MEMAVEHRPSANPVANPVCSVCIANYNGMQTIDACIASVLSQNFDLPVEIIVHDDASTDTSAEHIKDNFPNIELLISDKNIGYCISNNRMVDIARGQYILLLNNDAELYTDALDTLYNHAQNQEKPGILSLPQYDHATDNIIDYGMDLDPFLNPIPRKEYQRPQAGTVHGACFWIPADLWRTFGGFPRWFESVAEDLYLCVYAWCVGYSVEVPNKSGYLHWVGKSFGGGLPQQDRLTTTYKRRSLSERNKTYTMLLFYPWLALPLLALHFILLFMEGILLSILLKDRNIWGSIYGKTFSDVFRNINQIHLERKTIHHSHKIKSQTFLPMIRILPYKLYLLLRYGLPRIYSKT